MSAVEVYATKDQILGNATTTVTVEGRTGWKETEN